MGVRRTVVSWFIRTLLNIIAKIDCHELVETLKNNKPLLVIFNHVNFLEIPILIVFNHPVYITGLAKAETWKNPLLSFLFNTYKAVPIDRRGAFSESFKKVCLRIKSGFHMCVAPEGHRSKSGVLQHGKPGIIQLALEAGVPILPVAHHGGENIWKNLKRLRRTPFKFKVGRPFRIKLNEFPGHEKREEVLSEIMGQIARLLPRQFRGIYARQAETEAQYLEFV
jgi:1-acyl-sn-glycerol-3-phosphate acyltransferase